MNNLKLFLVALFLLPAAITFAQDKRSPSEKETRTEKPVVKTDFMPGNDKKHVEDVRIISSSASHIEIEFTPQYLENGIDFLNASSEIRKYGEPDVKIKSFPLFLPVDKGNRIEILDYKYEDIQGVDIQPVPTPKKSEDKLGWSFENVKNDKVYNNNSFFPSSPAIFMESGVLRNKYYGHALISPVLYNPVTKTVRKYSYIRFRVTFAGSPVLDNKQQSLQEMSFLHGMAVNSQVSLNWSTREYVSQQDVRGGNSVLAGGNFYKIEIKETGIYKLDKAFLQSAGINLQGIDPKAIKIYGNGGMELPYSNAIPTPTDLVENRIFVAGEDDGTFNDEDYVLFYGKSPNDWRYDPVSRRYIHYINHYSASNYYFITVDGLHGIRMQNIPSPNVQGVAQVTAFKDMIFEEPEVNNLGSTGNLWLSQKIGQGESYNFNKDLKGYISNSNVEMRLRIGNASAGITATFEIKDENSSYSVLDQVSPPSNPDGFSHINLENIGALYSLGGNSSIRLKISLPSAYNQSNVEGYLDYYETHYQRSISSADNNLIKIHAPDTNGVLEYNVSTFSTDNIKVFDITDEASVNLITPISIGGGTVRFQANHQTGNPNEFIVSGENYKTPVSISSRIANQDIHGIADGASFIILAPTEFMAAANRLKSYRENSGFNSLKTIVFDINQVYNEFSGGLQDPVAVRNLLKHAFNNWQERPVYVLFLGDGSYDYKNLYSVYNSGLKNWLPPVQKTTDDINEINSYPSDDFATDINENYETPIPVIPDFAAGRICANSLDEANDVIDKIIAYESPTTSGLWKKKIMYVADDGWTTTYTNGGEGALHTSQSETVAEVCTPRDFEKEKIYIVSYPTSITPQGRRKPGANVDIIKGWNEGRLVINYVGHGSTDLWAHEQIFERLTSIPQLNNKDKYPLVTIASCDLARYDDPFFLSAAEQLLNLKERGGIGVIAAVRPVYSAQNAAFNEELWRNFAKLKDTLNLPIRIAKAMLNTKSVQSPNDNNAKFTLIGDPTLRVSIPQYFTRIDSINNVPGTSVATIKALQKVKISGSVLRPDSTFWGDYNGTIDVKIFDVDKSVTVFDFGVPFNFRLDGGKIFNGKANVVNGLWTIEFIVPKDISYNNGNGKLIAYFNNSTSDGSGYSNNFILNGLDTTAYADTTGPQVSLFMGDRNFRSGDLINQNSKIVADFFDESGMNLTGTIGHKIEAVINGDENNKLDLTSFYNSTSNYQNGTLEYPIENLADGSYTLKLVAWDTYNNVSTTTVDFKVQNNSQLQVQRVYNYPNPMADNTSFLFQHNFDVPLNVKVKVYTVSGRLIKELNKTNITDKFVQLDWDGRDDDGDAIANGTYIYKVVINSEDGSFSTNSTGKLAKLK